MLLLLISAPSLRVIIVNNWLCLSVPLSQTFKLILLFCFRMELSHFLPSFLDVPLYKTLFFDIWFRPLNAQNLLPKICTKSPISRLVWQTDRRCLGLPGGFLGWPIQWNHAKCCVADPCCMATKFGLGSEIQSPTGLLILLVRERSALATLIFTSSVCLSFCLSATSELNISETRPDSGMVIMDGLYKLAYGLSIGHTPDDVTW